MYKVVARVIKFEFTVTSLCSRLCRSIEMDFTFSIIKICSRSLSA